LKAGVDSPAFLFLGYLRNSMGNEIHYYLLLCWIGCISPAENKNPVLPSRRNFISRQSTNLFLQKAFINYVQTHCISISVYSMRCFLPT
jgi:hypothetical protein